jgi:hypothetical protein
LEDAGLRGGAVHSRGGEGTLGVGQRAAVGAWGSGAWLLVRWVCSCRGAGERCQLSGRSCQLERAQLQCGFLTPADGKRACRPRHADLHAANPRPLLGSQAPPQLPRDQFSPEFCDFVSKCLQKDCRSRPSVQVGAHQRWLRQLGRTGPKMGHGCPADAAAWLAWADFGVSAWRLGRRHADCARRS